MPARGDGLALLKWITSFPGNPRLGLPTVSGVVCLSDATTGLPLMLLDARSVTALRTGAVAAVAAQALAAATRSLGRRDRVRAARAWAARCLAAAGYGPGVCTDPSPAAAEALARGARTGRVGSTAAGARAPTSSARHPGRGAGHRRRRPAPRPAPQHARRRRPGQGRGDGRGGRRLHACSATSGRRPPTAASSPARSRPAWSAASRSPSSAPCWPARPGAGRTTRR